MENSHKDGGLLSRETIIPAPMSSLDPIFRPTSIAVIGASRRPNTIGWQLVDNLLEHGFCGPIYPVNPKAKSIHSIPAYASVGDLPEVPDLAVIVVPSEVVVGVTRECIAAGVRGLVVISAGFKEVGGTGVELEHRLTQLVREHGVPMIGPNCMGVINTAPSVSMNATFAPSMPPPGPVAFVSQSGALGLSVLDYAESLGIGISAFVSVGNKADVSGNDLLEYWRDDPNTRVILMYLESFGNPARFIELAKTITRDKPICVVKSGRTGAGARAAQSHTGALAGSDLATDAILAQAGAIRVNTVEELFDLSMVFANQPLPEGNRVAIVTNAGGPGIMIADACESNGLEVTGLHPETENKLRSRLPEEASVHNPVDLIASATPETYEFALASVFDDPNVDAAIAAFVPPLGILTKDVAQAIVRVNSRHPEKPLLAVLMGRQGVPAGVAELHEAHVPAYIFPESAARALGATWRYRATRDRRPGTVVSFETDDDAVRRLLDAARTAGQAKLSEPDALCVLQAYGIRVPEWQFVPFETATALASHAAQAAGDIGFPVALKIVSDDVTHKTDVGGVSLNIRSKSAITAAVRKMLDRMSENPTPVRVAGVLVQAMASSGAETIVGITRVPRVGPMVMFGLGGIYVEIMRDVVLRLCPLEDRDAEEMIREVKASKLLEGVRGEAPRDVAALADVILRMSQLSIRHPRIAEMDINPLLAYQQGLVAVDARIQLDLSG